MGGILNAIASYNPSGFVQENQQREANLAQTQNANAVSQQVQQENELKLAQQRRAAKDDDLMRQATIESGGDPNKYRQALIKKGASPTAILSFDEARAKTRYETSRADKESLAAEQEGHKMAQGTLDALMELPDTEQALRWGPVAQQLNQKFGLQLNPQYRGKDALQFDRNQLALGGALLTEATTKQELTNKINTDARAAAGEARAAELQPSKVAEAVAQATSAQQKAAGTEPIQPLDREKQLFEEKQAEARLLQAAKESELNRGVTVRGQDMQAATSRRGQDLTDSRRTATNREKPLPATAIKTLDTTKGNYDTLDRLDTTFKEEYGGHPVTGNLENWIGRTFGDPRNEGQAQWWQDYQSYQNTVRHGLFGGALTPTEQAEFDKQSINPSMKPEQIKANIGRQKAITDKVLKRTAAVYEKGGYSRDQINEYVAPATSAAGGGGQSGAKKVNTQAEFDALPAGAEFVDAQDGKTYRKK